MKTHILFVTRHYLPEKIPPSIRISETAARLVKRGYQVTVLTTFPNHPSGVVPPEYRGHIIQREVHEGINVIRVWSYIAPNRGFFHRILAQLSFAWTAPFLGWKYIGDPDLIFVQSPPLFNAIGGRILAWAKRCPFVFVVADLWPESAVQLGLLRNRVLIRLAEWLEWSTYQKASLVWAVAEGIRDAIIQRGLPSERVFLLTNGVDTAKFRPLPRAWARRVLGWDDRFTILYAGTHGLSHGLTTILDGAEQLLDRNDMRFVFVGDGSEKAGLVVQARKRGLKNVTFLDPLSHDRMPILLSAADVCLVPMRKLPLFEGRLPAKIFELMACACPILLGVDGETCRLVVEEAGAALHVEPENPSALVSAILYLYDHPEVARRLGQQGRAFVSAKFDRERLTTVLETHIIRLLGKEFPNVPSRETPVPVSLVITPMAANEIVEESSHSG